LKFLLYFADFDFDFDFVLLMEIQVEFQSFEIRSCLKYAIKKGGRGGGKRWKWNMGKYLSHIEGS
jgi:hypothetical protein